MQMRAISEGLGAKLTDVGAVQQTAEVRLLRDIAISISMALTLS